MAKRKRTKAEEEAYQRFGERISDPRVMRIIPPPKPKKKERTPEEEEAYQRYRERMSDPAGFKLIPPPKPKKKPRRDSR